MSCSSPQAIKRLIEPDEVANVAAFLISARVDARSPAGPS